MGIMFILYLSVFNNPIDSYNNRWVVQWGLCAHGQTVTLPRAFTSGSCYSITITAGGIGSDGSAAPVVAIFFKSSTQFLASNNLGWAMWYIAVGY